MTRLLFVSDLHVLSNDALVLPDYVFYRGNLKKESPVHANQKQEHIYSEWQRMVDEVGTVQHTFILGDVVEGINPEGGGVGVMSTDLGEQGDMGVELLDMINCNNYYGVQGSSYHVGHNAGLDRYVLKMLTSKYHTRFIFGDEITVPVNGFNVHCRHVQPFRNKPEHRPNAMLEEIKIVVNDPQYEPGTYHFLARGHCHYFQPPLKYAGIEYLCCPGWKWRDSYVAKRSMGLPDLGYYVVDIDKNGRYDTWWNTFRL